MIHELAHLPLAEDIPIAFNSCRRGPRSVGWRSDKPAELTWTEAQVRSSCSPLLLLDFQSYASCLQHSSLHCPELPWVGVQLSTPEKRVICWGLHVTGLVHQSDPARPLQSARAVSRVLLNIGVHYATGSQAHQHKTGKLSQKSQ